MAKGILALGAAAGIALAAGLWSGGVQAAEEALDPLHSVVWDVLRAEIFGKAPVVFDDRVVVTVPTSAEDTLSVPVAVDARGLPGVAEMMLFADLNPIPVILRYHPTRAEPYFATRFKVQQGTPVRGAARTADGVWHVGGRYLDAAGGGCTTPALAHGTDDWAEHLGEVQARAWEPDADGSVRLRLRVRHPMDTGLAPGIPAYFIETLTVRDSGGGELGRLETFEPVSENPVFTLEVKPPPGARGLTLDGRDIGGAEFKATVPLPRAGGAS